MAGYNLSWDESNRSSTLLDSLSSRREQFSDVSIITQGGKMFRSHRLVLAGSSPYFENVFNQTEDKQNNLVLCLPDVNEKYFDGILNFIYQGQTKVDAKELADFTNAAKRLKIRGLTTDDQIKTEAPEDENDDEEVPNEEEWNVEEENIEPERKPSPGDTIVVEMGNLKCPFCRFKKNKPNMMWKTLIDHVTTKHNSKMRFKCNKCELVFEDIELLKKHYSSKHNKRKQTDRNVFLCNYCDYKALKRENLDNHLKFAYHENMPQNESSSGLSLNEPQHDIEVENLEPLELD